MTMKKWSWLLFSLLISAGAQAQMYKWVAPDGKITYSDTPPPSSVKKVEEKTLAGGADDAPALPFELAKAVKASPVTLYTTAKCDPCNAGRDMLHARGIPFTEKTVATSEEIAKFRQISGDQQLPLLTVGAQKQHGFQSNEWDAALSAAGYPETSKLPKDFRNPPPQAIVQKQKAVEHAATGNGRGTDAIEDAPPAAGNAPPGFRF
jgi:glutaredoxin